MSETTERLDTTARTAGGAHTPGPWEVREFGSEVVIDSLPGVDGRRTRIAVPMFCDEMEEECEANAYLIAAAPSLRAQLTAALQENERLKQERDSFQRVGIKAQELADTANDDWRRHIRRITDLERQLASGAEELKQEREKNAKMAANTSMLLDMERQARAGVFSVLPEALRGDGPCSRCGTMDNPVWFTENVLWNNTVRANMEIEPILCINCFVCVVDAAGFNPTGWRLLAEWPWREGRAERIVDQAMDALESDASLEQRRAAWDALRDHFHPVPPEVRAALSGDTPTTKEE